MLQSDDEIISSIHSATRTHIQNPTEFTSLMDFFFSNKEEKTIEEKRVVINPFPNRFNEKEMA